MIECYVLYFESSRKGVIIMGLARAANLYLKPQRFFPDAVFEEEPRNTTCVLGQNFLIQCRPPGHAATARWLFGGERLYITHPPPGVNTRSHGNLFELDISCTPARHYLTIQCIAVINIGVEEESTPVWIRVRGKILQLVNNLTIYSVWQC